MRGSEMKNLAVNIFFWLVYVPIAVLLTPFFVIWELVDNLYRGILFKIR
jgi:hypothetical protein